MSDYLCRYIESGVFEGMLESDFTDHFTDNLADTANGEGVHKLRICAPGDIAPKSCKIIN